MSDFTLGGCVRPSQLRLHSGRADKPSVAEYPTWCAIATQRVQRNDDIIYYPGASCWNTDREKTRPLLSEPLTLISYSDQKTYHLFWSNCLLAVSEPAPMGTLIMVKSWRTGHGDGLTVQQVIMIHTFFCCCWTYYACDQNLLIITSRNSATWRHGTSHDLCKLTAWA